MDILVYVSDPETDKILFANSAMEKSLGMHTSLVGKTCWKTIHNDKSSRCEFCKLPQLLESPEVGPVVWEYRAENNGKRYIIHDCLIQWENGKNVHLEYAINIDQH